MRQASNTSDSDMSDCEATKLSEADVSGSASSSDCDSETADSAPSSKPRLKRHVSNKRKAASSVRSSTRVPLPSSSQRPKKTNVRTRATQGRAIPKNPSQHTSSFHAATPKQTECSSNPKGNIKSSSSLSVSASLTDPKLFSTSTQGARAVVVNALTLRRSKRHRTST